ncbi:MAG: hypothetical protein GY856_39935 [bacterium]|nr:hypothetical protein [bacterium]
MHSSAFAGAGHRLTLERLEYGKLCRPSGVIEDGAEHRILGFSPHFPDDLLPLAQPSEISVRESSTDEVPPDCPHGIVLRSVSRSEETGPPHFHFVIGWIGQRREGTGQGGRRYTIARYLVGPAGEVPPFTLLYSVCHRPLTGLTRSEARRITAFHLEHPVHLSPPDELDKKFLSRALVYILTGVPLAISHHVAEQRFFHWVDLLWLQLPSPLKEQISAGWGTGSYLSGSLSITYAHQPAANCAVFNPRTGEWRNPETVENEIGTEVKTLNFDAGRLATGKSFAYFAYPPVDDEGFPTLTRMGVSSNARSFLDACIDLAVQPASAKLRMPHMRQRRTYQICRLPGLCARDHILLDRLKVWLEYGGESLDTDYLFTEYRGFTLAKTKRDAVNLIQRFFCPPPDQQQRADQALWSLIRESPDPDVLEDLSQGKKQGSRRALLFKALVPVANIIRSGPSRPRPIAVDDFKNLMTAAKEAARHDEVNDLPSDVKRHLHNQLDWSLEDAQKFWCHRILIEQDALNVSQIPDWYKDWICKDQPEFFMALSNHFRPGEETELEMLVQKVRELTPAEQMEHNGFLSRWIILQPPLPSDRMILDRLPAQAKLVECTTNRWSRRQYREPGSSEPLLEWFRFLRPGPADVSDPLIRLALNYQLNPEQIGKLKQTVAAAELPKSLAVPAAALALSHYLSFRDEIKRNPGWGALCRYWPPDVRSLLLEAAEGVSRAEVPISIRQAAQKLTLPLELLEDVIARCNRKNAANKARGVPYFWQLCERADPTVSSEQAAPVAYCCWYMHKMQQWPFVDSPPMSRIGELNEDQYQQLRGIFSLPPMKEVLNKRFEYLWGTTNRGWQLRTLLELFPENSPHANLDQVELMISQREWLRRRLRKPPKGKVNQRALQEFQLASFGFHHLNFEIAARKDLWRDELTNYALWAAFRNVPPALQGDLDIALSYYGKNITEMLLLCRIYLRKCPRKNRVSCLEKALSDFLLPLLAERGFSGNLTQFLLVEVKLSDAKEISRKDYGHQVGTLFGGIAIKKASSGSEAAPIQARADEGLIVVRDPFVPIWCEILACDEKAAVADCIKRFFAER